MVVKLPYSLHTHYSSIAVAWTIILIPPIFINLGLFYGLWYGTKLDRILVLTIPTAVLGVFTIIGTAERIYKLTILSATYRPLNSPRHVLDIFQWGYFGALIIISALISSALARGDADQDGHELQIRLISLPAALLMLFLATLTGSSLLLNAFQITLPFRFGSMEKGNILRPAIYYIVEDVVAVDGNGGIEFRKAWMERYNTSPVFKNMIWILSLIWMIFFFAFAAIFMTLVFVLPWQAVYAVGWAGPFPLAGWMALWTTFFVRERLRKEEEDGAEGDEEDEHDRRVLRSDEDDRRVLRSDEDETRPLLTE